MSDETITLETGGPAAPAPTPEQAELDRLRAENAALRAGAPAETKAVVKLAGKDALLVRAAALDERWNVWVNLRQPGREHVVMWACLGLCLPEYRQRDPYMGDLLSYGRRVLNSLLAEGCTFGEVDNAGAIAAQMLLRQLVEVEGAADFSGTPSDGAAPAGSSRASGS